MMLQRNLLYTALTRARKRAVIVCSGGLTNKQTGQIYMTALQVAVANDRIARRYSGLAERLEALQLQTVCVVNEAVQDAIRQSRIARAAGASSAGG